MNDLNSVFTQMLEALDRAHHSLQWHYNNPNKDDLTDIRQKIDGRDALACRTAITAGRAMLEARGEVTTADMVRISNPLTKAQIARLWTNSPEVHSDFKSYAAFERTVLFLQKVLFYPAGRAAPQPDLRLTFTEDMGAKAEALKQMTLMPGDTFDCYKVEITKGNKL